MEFLFEDTETLSSFIPIMKVTMSLTLWRFEKLREEERTTSERITTTTVSICNLHVSSLGRYISTAKSLQSLIKTSRNR